MYLAVCTRSNITHAVNYVSQFLEKPTERHWTMVKRIMRYKGSLMHSIYYAAAKSRIFEIYSDADYVIQSHLQLVACK